MNCANNSMSLFNPIHLKYEIKYDSLTNYLMENKMKTRHLGVNRNITIKLVTELIN